MKILAIRGRNLASLEGDFEIDYTTEPLRSAGIFAITGQTGAGKSTILDALCLALFDNAPRLNRAEIININDVGEKTITQKDSRNILRRGASEGYAEVDFIALNGDKYRSRWIVRRARGKADGALQPTTLEVENLSANKKEQGTKSNLLNRVVELVGLTFDQFTRAVLLAQGDFANFLKAKSNEKAELLEKLTGTEVYSKISEKIYYKKQEAKNALDLLHERIKDIRLLSDEELINLEQEKRSLELEIVPLKKQISSIEKKISWFQQDKQLSNELKEAQDNLSFTQRKLDELKPRYEYIEKLDFSLEIRDIYIELTNKRLFAEKSLVNLNQKQNELKAITEKYNKLTPDLNSAKDLLDETNQRYDALKPDIDKAKDIDSTLRNQEQELFSLQKEIEASQKQKTQCEENIALILNQKNHIIKKQVELNNWFRCNEIYSGIVPKIELIVNLINSTTFININKEKAFKSLQSSESLLKIYDEQLKQYESDFERLNNLLPTEIINLRNKLEEDKPCPVCGSKHHPLKENTNQTQLINESELEISKKKNQDSISTTKINIENIKKSITEFEVYTQSFDSQLSANNSILEEHLNIFPDWKTKLSSNSLQKELNDIATKWTEHKQMLDGCFNQLENIKIKIESEEKAKHTIHETLTKRLEQERLVKSIFNDKVELRKHLLGGKSVEEVEVYFTNQKKQLLKQYDELRNLKDKIENHKASISGNIAQLKNEIKISNNEIKNLSHIINNWLINNKYQITNDILKELLSKPLEWITQEKQYLSNIKNNRLVLNTTVIERQSRYVKNLESENKPADYESIDSLIKDLITKQAQIETITAKITELNVSLQAHKNAKEKIKTFEKELETKSDLFENWAKLDDLLGSANGNKFKTIAQGYTLDILLSYANKHLLELSKRYKLQKVTNSLALQVIDNDMLGEVRSVHSLSGGESFLLSLALALGLSSLSSNRMHIESLFIDEGFGALDIDTLSIAMDALDNLQTQGRKIGVISHVEEMKERITVQIQVIKSANGKSIVKIIG